MGAHHAHLLRYHLSALIYLAVVLSFPCINMKLHKLSVTLALRTGPEVVGGAHFLITAASFNVTHRHSGENSWSLYLFRLQGFSHFNNATPTPSTGAQLPATLGCLCASSQHTHAHTRTHTNTHLHLLPVVLDLSKAVLWWVFQFAEKTEWTVLMWLSLWNVL